VTRADRQRRLRWRIGSDPVNYRVAEAHLCADGRPRVPAHHRAREGEALWVEWEGRWEVAHDPNDAEILSDLRGVYDTARGRRLSCLR